MIYASKTLEPLLLSRRNHNANTNDSTIQNNLFRKDRREYSPPVQVAKLVPKKAPLVLPPPNLSLKGVLFLGPKKIAIIEGDYPVRERNQTINKNLLKKKRYPLGAKIGSFELTEIQKTNVTLKNKKGVVLSLNLGNRSLDKVIRRIGNTLVQQDENFNPENIKKVALARSSFKATLKKPKPIKAKRQGRPKEFWTRFKRDEGPAKQE